ncbi:MAG: peptidoglycan-binding protein [bacterium]
MLTDLQKKTAQAIVNIFETGQPKGDYGMVTLLAGDPGHLTYGRTQTTLASGNLYILIKAYCESSDAECASELKNYLTRLANRDTSLDYEARLRSLLCQAGDDPVMKEVQDRFFDRVYWDPCIQAANYMHIESGLGVCVVYDSKIHGSWVLMRDRTIEQHGAVKDIGENRWVEHYVSVRRKWLADHRILILRKTTYRMDTFRKLIGEERWSLDLPFYVRGIKIDEEVLDEGPIRVSAQDVEERLLFLQTPYMQGDDIRTIQKALKNSGFKITVDGIFGSATDDAVRKFQRKHKMKVDGIVGPATRSALGL